MHLNGYSIKFTDILSLYVEYKDIFVRRIYHFNTPKLTPNIVDGGGCIGMSVLYFKSIYPESRITCFEPDREVFEVLQQNISKNGLTDVELVNAGLAKDEGMVCFAPDGVDGGKIVDSVLGSIYIKTVRLSDYLSEPVDFLKLNIEGQELPVLLEVEASGKFCKIHEMVIEYHGWANGEQRLGEILNLLDRNGFLYMVHDFDAETCSVTKPPFHMDTKTTWFCLIYAKKND